MTSNAWSQPAFEAIAQLVSARVGLALNATNHANVERAARRAMAQMAICEVNDFARQLGTAEPCWQSLIDEITVGETYFFRNPEQFALVRDTVLPALLHLHGRAHALSVWSAGCASGEEAYSLAILLDQAGLLQQARVFGSDISQRALTAARNGRYRAWSFRGSDPALVARYFGSAGDDRVLSDAIRSSVSFHAFNMALDGPLLPPTQCGGVDLILCRNLLIYLDAAAIRRAEQKLFSALAPGGFLIMGPSDPMFGQHAPFTVMVTERGLLYRRPAPDGSEPAVARQPLAGLDHPASPPELPAPPLYREVRPGPEPGEAAHTPPDAGEQAARAVRATWNRRGANAAELECADAAARHALSLELQHLHALLLLDLGRHADALSAARRALYLDRACSIAHFTHASILEAAGDRHAAQRAYRNVTELCALQPADAAVPLADGIIVGGLARAAARAIERLGVST